MNSSKTSSEANEWSMLQKGTNASIHNSRMVAWNELRIELSGAGFRFWAAPPELDRVLFEIKNNTAIIARNTPTSKTGHTALPIKLCSEPRIPLRVKNIT